MSILRTIRTMRMFARLLGRVPTSHLWYLAARMRYTKPHKFGGQIRLNTFFPPFPSPAFDRFCEAIIHRRRVPYSTYVAVTGACPYRCEHCSYAGRAKDQMSRTRMLEVIGQIKSLGTSTLGLTGGEPLLRPDLEDFIRAAAPEMVTVIFTTGHGLDARRARQFADAGVCCMTIGIESSDPEAHDQVRGRTGSFAEAQAAVRTCRDAGIYTAISTIATRERIADGQLEAIYRLGEQWGVGEFRVLAPVATGAWKGCGAAMLTPEEMRWLYDFHVNHNRLRRGPTMACFAYLESDELFGCGAGFHHLFIDAMGNVCPCDLTPLSFGNALSEPLADIWDRMGRFFPLPRCGCLMGKIAGKLNGEYGALPLTPEQSEKLCPMRQPDDPIPEGYRRLLKTPGPVRPPRR